MELEPMLSSSFNLQLSACTIAHFPVAISSRRRYRDALVGFDEHCSIRADIVYQANSQPVKHGLVRLSRPKSQSGRRQIVPYILWSGETAQGPARVQLTDRERTGSGAGNPGSNSGTRPVHGAAIRHGDGFKEVSATVLLTY